MVIQTICMVLGVVVALLGIVCLASPDTFLKIDKAMTREVTRLDKLSMPFRLIVGFGLIWVGVFVATLPRFFR